MFVSKLFVNLAVKSRTDSIKWYGGRKERHHKFLLILSLGFSAILLIATYNASQNLTDKAYLPPHSAFFQNIGMSNRIDGGVLNTFNNQNQNQNQMPPEFQFKENLWRPVPIASVSAGSSLSKDGRKNDTSFDFSEYTDDRILKQRNWIQEFLKSKIFQDLKPKKILVLDGYYSYFGQSGHLNCPKNPDNGNSWESKCILVQDNWWTGFFRNFEEFHAVIGIRNWVYRIYEGKLPSWVKQILFTAESPFITRFADFSVNNAFLASYWRGSDIVMPYGKWIPYQKLPTNHNRSQIRIKMSTTNYAEGRTKLAALVVSDCKPQNNRLGYVQELQRHIPVDVLGKCGPNDCPEPCFENLKKQYKFYLAFENANCRDYITEKFFRNALHNDMVPIVLGAYKKDYLYAAPPNSFIHVEDFETPGKLANYLTLLDQNDHLYNEYFQWKQIGHFIDPAVDFFCRSCALLFIADFVQPPVWPKGSTWKQLNACLPPGRWYWNRPNN